MLNLIQENIIMSSNEESIVLTNHRVIQKRDPVNNEVFLKDLVSQTIVKRPRKYYVVLSIIFSAISLLAIVLYFTNLYPFTNAPRRDVIFFLAAPIVLWIASLVFLSKFKERFLKVTGKHGEVIFSLNDMDETNTQKFITRTKEESELRKQEG